MPGLGNVPPNVRTTYLGEYTRTHAQQLADRLESAGIVWWSKEPSFLSRLWEYGVRIFVDRARLPEAQALAQEVTGPDGATPGP